MSGIKTWCLSLSLTSYCDTGLPSSPFLFFSFGKQKFTQNCRTLFLIDYTGDTVYTRKKSFSVNKWHAAVKQFSLLYFSEKSNEK